MKELSFESGRAVVRLDDGTMLSIINEDRNEVIRAGKMNSPQYILHGGPWPDAHADEHTYEVCWEDSNEQCIHELIDPAWARYQGQDGDGYTIYGYVPKALVYELIEKRGLNP